MELVGTSSAGAVLASACSAQGVFAAGVPAMNTAMNNAVHNAPDAARGAAPGAANPAHTTRIEVEEIGAYDVDRLNKVLTEELAEFSQFEISYTPAQVGVKLYRVTYPSVVPERNNRPTTASGLIAIPAVSDKQPASLPVKLPVVSYQHGSVFGKEEVPSFLENSTETRLMVAVFGGQGYMVIGADYFGKGVSPEPNGYIVKESTEQACLDMLLAAQTVCPDLGVEMGPLLLSGWSQAAGLPLCSCTSSKASAFQ